MTQFLLGIFSWILISAISGILGQDARTLAPIVSRKLLEKAAKRIDGELSERMLEEWLSHLEESDFITQKLAHAVSIYVYGASKIARESRSDNRSNKSYLFVKRLMDITLIILAAPVLMPSLLVLCLIPMFYGHAPFRKTLRRGRKDKPFYMLRYNFEPLYEKSPRLYSALEKASVGELPTLYNVLSGDMSIIGPSSHSPNTDLHGMRPGLSGMWQISGNKDQRAMNERYSKQASLKLDLQIIIKTFRQVTKSENGGLSDYIFIFSMVASMVASGIVSMYILIKLLC